MEWGHNCSSSEAHVWKYFGEDTGLGASWDDMTWFFLLASESGQLAALSQGIP